MTYTDQIDEMIGRSLITPDKHHAIFDYAFQKHLAAAPWNGWLSKSNYFNVYDEYLGVFDSWINSTTVNRITGLDRFVHTDVIVGTTQTFDEAYYTYANKRLRVFNGEYGYHKRNVDGVVNLDEAGTYVPLSENDWVIVSVPFCGTGDTHKHYETMLADAERLGVPVVVDCAWFGTCHDIHIDVRSPAIVSVSFSTSKGIGMGNMRTGVRYSNLTSGSIRQQNAYRHLVFSNMQLGIYQMQKFSPDFIASKYHLAYNGVCTKFGLTQTKCLHVAKFDSKLIGIRNLVKEFFKQTL